MITYKLDGKNLTDYGIRISASRGVLDLPALKQPKAYEWADSHGSIVDLKAPRYQSRSLIFDAWIETSAGPMDFADKLNAFITDIAKPGLHQLLVFVKPDKPLAFMVYLRDGMQVEKQWRDTQMFGTFQIKLEEPEPVKRVVKYTGTGATINFASPDMFNIYWGDGKVNHDVSGNVPMPVRHTYAPSGTYYICFAGNVDSLTAFTSNGTVLWLR